MIPNIFGLDPQVILIAIAVGMFIWLTLYRLDKTGIGDKFVNKLIVIVIISATTLIMGMIFFDCFWHAVDNNYFQKLPNTLREYGLIDALFSDYKPDENGPSIGFFKQGGMTFLGALYGAFFGYIISYWFIFKHERSKIIHYLNIILPGLILAHGLGRIGCFLSGCCTGIKAPFPLGFKFPYAPDPANPSASYIDPRVNEVIPANLYEAIFLIGLFFVLFFGLKKNQTKVYMVSYGTFRFFLEFLRGDSRGAVPILRHIPFLNWISPSQFLSIILIIVGILLFIFEEKLCNYLKKWDRPIIEKTKQASKN